MAQIPDLRVADPLRDGISADTVSIPDLIENLKAFNEAWVNFEKGLDNAHLKELITIAKTGEMLWRCLSMRAISIRASLRVDKYAAIETELEKLNQRKAAEIAHVLSEEKAIWSGVRMAETQGWVEKRIALLQKRLNNRKGWSEMRSSKAKA